MILGGVMGVLADVTVVVSVAERGTARCRMMLRVLWVPAVPAQVFLWGLWSSWGCSIWDRAGSGATPAQGTAEPLSSTSGASVEMCLEEQKMLDKCRREEERQGKSRRSTSKVPAIIVCFCD